MPSPPVGEPEATIACSAGALVNNSWTAPSEASRRMKSAINATALRATSGLRFAAVATRAIKFSMCGSSGGRGGARQEPSVDTRARKSSAQAPV